MSSPLCDGTVFAGRYQVVRCIATGGMGAVYEVIHLGTQRRRALKVMLPHLFQNDEMRERFVREARVTSLIESEYIVDVSDAGIDEATRMPYLVMELLRGEELEKRLVRVGRFSPIEVVTYLQQVASALDRAHQATIVHRDIKPANLFLTQREDGTPRVKILDFGVAKVLKENATAAGATRSLGTPLYMSPEQFRAGSKLTHAADIYSLGLVAYTLLVGEEYWSVEANQSWDVIALGMMVVRGPEVSAVQRAATKDVVLPASFDVWFSKVTATNPLDRFPTASEAIRALSDALKIAPNPAVAVDLAGRSSAAAPDERPSSPSQPAGPAATALAEMMTSTGAAVTPVRAVHRQAPLVVALAIVGLSAVSAVGFIALRSSPHEPMIPSPSEALSLATAAGTAVPTTIPDVAPKTPATEPAMTPTPTVAASASAITTASASPKPARSVQVLPGTSSPRAAPPGEIPFQRH